MMKKAIFLLVLSVLLVNCNEDDTREDNPYLLNINVNFNVNLSLPQYNNLNFVNNPVYISQYGNGGIILMKIGENQYVGYDAADPNHTPDNCSVLELDGLEGVCQCSDQNRYNLITGEFVEGENLEYTLYRYRVFDNGNGTLSVSN